MKKIIVGFPGAGKTFYVKKVRHLDESLHLGAVDLDIKGPDFLKKAELPYPILWAMTNYIEACLDLGLDVLTHVNAFDPYREYKATIILFVPKRNVRFKWCKRIFERGDEHFSDVMWENWNQWIADWLRFAKLLKENGNTVEVIRMNAKQYITDFFDIPEVDG